MPAKEFDLEPAIPELEGHDLEVDRFLERMTEDAADDLIRTQPRIRRRYRPVYLRRNDRRH